MKIVHCLITLLSCLTLLFVACSRPQIRTSVSLTDKLNSLFAGVPDFSGVLLIAETGKPLYKRAFGYKNFETKEPVTTSSIFELASVSKQFTAMTIMMLKEDGNWRTTI